MAASNVRFEASEEHLWAILQKNFQASEYGSGWSMPPRFNLRKDQHYHYAVALLPCDNRQHTLCAQRWHVFCPQRCITHDGRRSDPKMLADFLRSML